MKLYYDAFIFNIAMLASTSPEARRGTFPVPHQTEGCAREWGRKPVRSYNGQLAGTDVEETVLALEPGGHRSK